MLNYAEALKAQRELSGLTQSALSQKTGLSQQTISWCEAGKGLPNINFCVQLADFYSVSLDELVGRDFVYETKLEQSNKSFTSEELQLIEDYRALNYACKSLVKQTVATLKSPAAGEVKRKEV